MCLRYLRLIHSDLLCLLYRLNILYAFSLRNCHRLENFIELSRINRIAYIWKLRLPIFILCFELRSFRCRRYNCLFCLRDFPKVLTFKERLIVLIRSKLIFTWFFILLILLENGIQKLQSGFLLFGFVLCRAHFCFLGYFVDWTLLFLSNLSR